MTGFTKWDAFRRPNRRSGVCDDALEHCAGGPESIAGGTGSAGETLPNLLATCLQLHQATRDRIRGSRGPHSGFFALLLERRDLETVRREKGRLRSYVLVSLKHFLTNERHRAMTIKRGEGRRLVPLDALGDHEGTDLAPMDTLSADQIYERRWALTVLEEVLARLSDEYRAVGKAALFDRLKKLLTDEPDRPSQAEIADEFGMTENAVKQAFHRVVVNPNGTRAYVANTFSNNVSVIDTSTNTVVATVAVENGPRPLGNFIGALQQCSTPSPTPTPTVTPTPTPAPTATPTPTPTATPVSTPTPTATPSVSPSATPTPTPTATPRSHPTPRPHSTPRPRPTPPR